VYAALVSGGSSDDAVTRLRGAFDLFAAGEALMRENLRRRFPEASDEEIEDRLCRWLSERPGAEHGDAAGIPVTWPRTRG
jgi:hypothetical protein